MEEMSSLDIYYVLKEINSLVGGKIDKIYQRDRNFRIQIYANGESHDLILSPGKVYLSNFDRKGPIKPPTFCMFLRKYLRNQRLKKIKQHKFDRIIELHTENKVLIGEVFGKGNFILLEKNGEIIQPLEIQRWSQREIISKRKYKYPPAGIDPRRMTKKEFKGLVSTDDEIVRTIARRLNLGGKWAEEVCFRANIDKNHIGEELSREELASLHKCIMELFDRKIEPEVIFDKNGKMIAAVPFTMQKYQAYEKKKFETFNQALDYYFSNKESMGIEESAKKIKEEKISKFERIEKEQKEAIDKWKKIKKESKKKADLIYENYSLIEDILNGIQKAINSDLEWDEIKQRINNEDSPQSRAIEEINEDEESVTVNVDDEKLELNFNQTVEGNAEGFYEDMKWADKKLERVKEEIESTKRKKQEIENKSYGKFADTKKMRGKPEEKIKVKEIDGWFKKYRWFKTSDGHLVVTGKSAKQNEEIIKKQTEKTDIVLHADIPGSPFAVIKNENENISPSAIKEAAEFCASFSRAWRRNYGSVDMYWVRPNQVSKDTPSGESISKGSFMIKGEKNYLKKTELKISVGVILDRDSNQIRIVNGSTQSVRNSADYFVTITPGENDRIELAKQIKNKLGEKAKPEDQKYINKIGMEKIKPLVPSGGGIIVG